MLSKDNPQYYLIEAGMVPEIFIKVTKAKELLETGEAATIAEAVSKVGISRSAFYKYKDSISPFLDKTHSRIITFHILLRNKPGVLSTLISIFAESGSNILTINQSIPFNGTAAVTISAETVGSETCMSTLIDKLRNTKDIIKAEVLAG